MRGRGEEPGGVRRRLAPGSFPCRDLQFGRSTKFWRRSQGGAKRFASLPTSPRGPRFTSRHGCGAHLATRAHAFECAAERLDAGGGVTAVSTEKAVLEDPRLFDSSYALSSGLGTLAIRFKSGPLARASRSVCRTSTRGSVRLRMSYRSRSSRSSSSRPMSRPTARGEPRRPRAARRPSPDGCSTNPSGCSTSPTWSGSRTATGDHWLLWPPDHRGLVPIVGNNIAWRCA